jgi:hypothetical protein
MLADGGLGIGENAYDLSADAGVNPQTLSFLDTTLFCALCIPKKQYPEGLIFRFLFIRWSYSKKNCMLHYFRSSAAGIARVSSPCEARQLPMLGGNNPVASGYRG